ncbi:MAG: putative toxin-antitoxin system toxin component, PIN family [Deltaproteobacteria bacterium]|nr:putative toxin-antitoxin system toxin component, PIN family [Deltaproteobacteria bacterium]
MVRKRVIVDTNIVISGLLSSKGASARILDLWIRGQFIAITSKDIENEYVSALQYHRIKKRLGESLNEAVSLLKQLISKGERIKVKSKLKIFSDPKDDIFIQTAVDGSADSIVTGDLVMLKVVSHNNILIMSPSQFIYGFDE